MKSILLILLVLLIVPTVAIAQDTESDPFVNTIVSVIDSAWGGADWSTGYARSFAHPEKEGIVLKASRLITTFKFSDSYDFNIYGDLIGVEASNSDNDVLGLGLSTSLKGFMGIDIGIAYIAGGYGWSTTITPISIKF